MNKHREPGCTGVTPDKKYYKMTTTTNWTLSTYLPQRWKTDATILLYLREKTNIPLPRLYHTFEDNGAFYFSTEPVPGVSITQLMEEQKQVVTKELLEHIATLKSLRSDTPGVPGQTLLYTPNRAYSCYVFCHNDLGQHNVIVDPETLKINAIIDWEYGGFWPEWFERPYWERKGPSAPLAREEDDAERCREWLLTHCVEVEMEHLRSLKEKLGGQS
ncbi:kinase-like domain protein [Dichotomopilus funicola]|uniref:Kinase-like domain protein n=1 Tax=Dichotomopilus funicola TaxID=1934379 RepID=A0AAN6UZP1_9PEZI|nr:kinase-like domain protein [Dichotomopilus funicola]